MQGAFESIEEICSTEGVLFGGAVGREGRRMGLRYNEPRRVRSTEYSEWEWLFGNDAARTKRMLDGEDVDPWSCLFITSEYRRNRPDNRNDHSTDPTNKSVRSMGNR